MQLKTVNFDGDLEEAEAEDLRSLVQDFEKAQEANAAEFEAAKERLEDTLGDDAEFDEVFGEVADFAEAKDSLIGEITEFDSFEESPMSESILQGSDFDELREYKAYFADLDVDEDEESDKEFADMGKQGPTSPDEDAGDAEFADKFLGGMPGFQPGAE